MVDRYKYYEIQVWVEEAKPFLDVSTTTTAERAEGTEIPFQSSGFNLLSFSHGTQTQTIDVTHSQMK